ncbi:MAG: HIRAN domain-containing protein [Sporichthyaceae bacterium]
MLVREPNNPYDPMAVAVVIYGHLVGYLKRDDAAELADELDDLADEGQFLCAPACYQGGTPDKPTIGVVVEVREASDRVK